MKLNLYESIVNIECLFTDDTPIGVRVHDTKDGTYDVSLSELVLNFGNGIIPRLFKVLDSSVFIPVQVKVDEGHVWSHVPLRMYSLVSRLKVIADFRGGTGDTNVVAVGGVLLASQGYNLFDIDKKYQAFDNFHDFGGVELYVLDERRFVIKHVPSNSKYVGVGDYYYGEQECISLNDIESGRSAYFTFLLNGTELGCRTAEIYGTDLPIVSYLKSMR